MVLMLTMVELRKRERRSEHLIHCQTTEAKVFSANPAGIYVDQYQMSIGTVLSCVREGES